MDAKRFLDRAARAAWRAVGDAEPNPLVGCVIARDGVVLGIGHHRRFGDLHAERAALANCVTRGNDARGATAFVTLEPCCHVGRQPPCTEALAEAGVARVVYARRDPGEVSRGGAEVLSAGGIPCELCEESVLAIRLSDPFVKRVETGLPWVIAKWAQTSDGRLVTRPDEGRWISGEMARRRVHRMRARVDAVVTGIGTVLADDPSLDAREVRRVRRVAKRVVVSTDGRAARDTKLGRGEGPGEVVWVRAEEMEAWSERRGRSPLPNPLPRGVGEGGRQREDADKSPHPGPVPRGEGGRVDLAAMLAWLADEHGVATVMLECGPTLLGSFFESRLVDEALVHVAPGGEGEITGEPAKWVHGMACVCRKALGGDTEWWMRGIG